MSVHTLVALFSGISAFTNHSFITFAAPRASLRCTAFCFYCAVGVVCSGLFVGCIPSSETLVLVICFSTTCFLSRPLCCSPILLVSFTVVCLPRCITFFPFTLRRASQSKPPNIYYSPFPLLFHCKIHTPLHRSHTTHVSFSLT